MDWIWMRNDVTGGVARFPASTKRAWEGRGWVEVPEPVDEDDERVGQRAPEQGQETRTRRAARRGGDDAQE